MFFNLIFGEVGILGCFFCDGLKSNWCCDLWSWFVEGVVKYFVWILVKILEILVGEIECCGLCCGVFVGSLIVVLFFWFL